MSNTERGSEELQGLAYQFMYCPECDRKVAPNWVDEAEDFLCAKCETELYENKEEYIDCLHGAVVWQRERGYGPWGERWVPQEDLAE